jgi:hypothetical protein
MRKSMVAALLLFLSCGGAFAGPTKRHSHPATRHKSHDAPSHKGSVPHGTHKSHPAPSHPKPPKGRTR